MNLLEHEAKHLLSKSGVPIPASTLITKTTTELPIPLPLVLKSQVPSGKRGKAGGVHIVTSEEEFRLHTERIFHLPIEGILPRALLAEELIPIEQELYLAILINRASRSIELLANSHGGIEIESLPQESFFRRQITLQTIDSVARELATYYRADNKANQLATLLRNLLICFTKNDATLLEINPLTITKQNTFIALDCKMTLDSSAAFRHQSWKSYSEQPTDANFVTLDPQGSVATIANGAGLAMATVDAVAAARLPVANFLDIGGGATVETISSALDRLALLPNVQAIIVNIFAGITRADHVAYAVIAAKKKYTSMPPLFIRLEGTNEQEARTLLSGAAINTYPDLSSAIRAAQQFLQKGSGRQGKIKQ